LKEWANLLQQNKFSTPIAIAAGSGSTYGFVLNFPDFAAVGKVFAEYQALIEKKHFKDIIRSGVDQTNGENVWLSMSRPDLSYVPENPRIQQGEAQYVRYTFLHIEPGTEDRIDAALKKFAALYRKHKISTGFIVGAAITGTNLPFYVVGVAGKSAADLFTENEKNIAAMGAEWQALFAEIGSMLRTTKILEIQPRPDLSYMPK
jgi:hypothetical protein